LLYGSDTPVAEAAAFALGQIGGADAAKTLQGAMTRINGPVRVAVTTAGERPREDAFSLYNALTATSVTEPVRLAALHGIIAAETSLSRPR
jgi:hypothetical protein